MVEKTVAFVLFVALALQTISICFLVRKFQNVESGLSASLKFTESVNADLLARMKRRHLSSSNTDSSSVISVDPNASGPRGFGGGLFRIYTLC